MGALGEVGQQRYEHINRVLSETVPFAGSYTGADIELLVESSNAGVLLQHMG